ncbi:MAG: putative basic amino acid antiporter YfcC [Peptostreptococcaceae bacterium]
MTQKQKKGFQMPDTYVIIFMVVMLATISTYFIETGKFEVLYKVVDNNQQMITLVDDGEVESFEIDGKTFTIDALSDPGRTLVLDGDEVVNEINKSSANSYEHKEDNETKFRVTQEYGEYVGSGETDPVALFEPYGEVGFFNFAFEGLVTGSKWGTAVGIVAFILISGGAFGIVLNTGAVEIGILSLMKKYDKAQFLIIPVLFLSFAIGGVVFGMSEETIPLAMIIVPIMIAMGYDSIVALMITFVAAQIGFASSWMNPFSVAIAQGIAGIPVLSGASFRMIMFAVLSAFTIAYTLAYAKKIKEDPTKSVAYESDSYYRENFNAEQLQNEKFTLGHTLVVLTVAGGIAWTVWGVSEHGYYIPEIASIFFTMGVISGIIGVIFKLNDMTINDIAYSFKNGAKDLAGAAMIVGMAQGIILVLGGRSPYEYTVMNTLLHSTSQVLQGVPAVLSGWFMFVCQSILNIFIVSGSGQAAVTMPLMAPLADLVGVTRQVAVLAFQLGDGLMNIIVPTSATLMAVLGVARIDWKIWAKFQAKFLSSLFVIASIFVVIASLIGYN